MASAGSTPLLSMSMSGPKRFTSSENLPTISPPLISGLVVSVSGFPFLTTPWIPVSVSQGLLVSVRPASLATAFGLKASPPWSPPMKLPSRFCSRSSAPIIPWCAVGATPA